VTDSRIRTAGKSVARTQFLQQVEVGGCARTCESMRNARKRKEIWSSHDGHRDIVRQYEGSYHNENKKKSKFSTFRGRWRRGKSSGCLSQKKTIRLKENINRRRSETKEPKKKTPPPPPPPRKQPRGRHHLAKEKGPPPPGGEGSSRGDNRARESPMGVTSGLWVENRGGMRRL